MKKLRIALFILIPVVVLLFSSCLGLLMETQFNHDGSGRMTMVMHISQALLQLGSDEAGVDIPLSKDDLVTGYQEVDGITVVDVIEEETEEHRIITAIIEFENFNDLAGEEGFPGEEASLIEKDGKYHFKVLLGRPDMEAAQGQEEENSEAQQMEMDEATEAMVQSFMEGYSFEYRITAPKKILSYSHGELSKDKKTLLLSLPMGEYFMIDEPYYLEVVW